MFIMKRYLNILILILIVFMSFIISSSIGAVNIPFNTTINIFLSTIFNAIPEKFTEVQKNIIIGIRLPRVLLGMIVGSALSLSGLVFQALLKNPLADPYTLGISAGASFGAAIAIFLSYAVSVIFKSLLPFFAFSGGIATIFLVYFLARVKGRVQVLTIILAGVVVSYIFSSGVVLIMSLLGDKSHEIIFWLMGSLAGYHSHLVFISLIILVLMIFVIFFYRDLDLMALGDDQAKSLGVNTDVVRLVLFSITSLITSMSVSLTGTIGFVGLIVPHSMRLIFGPKHKVLIPSSILVGASFLPISDCIARTVPSVIFQTGMEIPVGVITSLFGAPFFIFLLIRGKKRYWF